MSVRIISVQEPVEALRKIVPRSEDLIAYKARVSNKENQGNWETGPKLISWLVKNHHWSPLEMVNVCMEIETVRAISAQIMRHRSFTFQELSQRYTTVGFRYPELRMKGDTNRQGSLDKKADKDITAAAIRSLDEVFSTYEYLVNSGVALESARMILPMTSETTIYMNGNLRSWYHFCKLRMSKHTQKEHRHIANKAFELLEELYPNVFEAIEEVESH